ncbi:unnamed protein product [Boreogadus saida]
MDTMDSKTIRTCKTCNTGYILPHDGHEVCEGCLGHKHALLALLALSPLCLFQHCKALPVDYRQRRADTAGVIDFNAPLDDAPSLLANSESDDSDRVVGALVAELPGIIARAAANLGLVVPMPQAPQRPD